MSTEYYRVGLWWDGRRGRAKHDDVEITLRRAPVLGKLVPDRLEFNPALAVYEIADRSVDPKRDMTPDEIDEANLWLLRMSSAARQVVG